MKPDKTFDTICAYGSALWVARRLGLSRTSFYRKREELEARGFPKSDPMNSKYLKDDVDAWIKKQRRVGESPKLPQQGGLKIEAI